MELNMDIWNVKNLTPPPILRCKAAIKEVDLKVLRSVLQQGFELFSNQQQLHKEAALLSRLIYRMKMKFRSSKDFKVLQKLNRSLLSYLNVNIANVIHQFMLSVPKSYSISETYLPSRNMLDYILVRLQGLGKLFLRIIESCKIACEAYQQRLRLGHFWKFAVLVYGICSRFFVICKYIIRQSCTFYDNLLLLRSHFTNSDCHVEWLPENYILPDKLCEWLEINWEELDKVIEIPDEDENIVSCFDLIDDDSDDDLQILDEYILIKDDDLLSPRSIKATYNHNSEFSGLRGFDNVVDIGEILNDCNPNTLTNYERPSETDNNEIVIDDEENIIDYTISNRSVEIVNEPNNQLSTPRISKKRLSAQSTNSIPSKKRKLTITPPQNNSATISTFKRKKNGTPLGKNRKKKRNKTKSPTKISLSALSNNIPKLIDSNKNDKWNKKTIGPNSTPQITKATPQSSTFTGNNQPTPKTKSKRKKKKKKLSFGTSGNNKIIVSQQNNTIPKNNNTRKKKKKKLNTSATPQNIANSRKKRIQRNKNK